MFVQWLHVLKVRSLNNTTVRRYGCFGDFYMAWWIVLGQVFDILGCGRLSDANLGVERDGRSLESSCGSLVLFGQPCSHFLEVSLMLMGVRRIVFWCSDWRFKGIVIERVMRERPRVWGISYGLATGCSCSCLKLDSSNQSESYPVYLVPVTGQSGPDAGASTLDMGSWQEDAYCWQ